MKKLYMKQQIFSVVDKFTIKDDHEEDRYFVHGDMVVIGGKKLHIEDMEGHELAMVHQKLLSLMPKFFVFRNGEQVAEIVKKLSMFKAKYEIAGLGWEIKGSVLDHDYTITSGGKQIVKMHKVWLSWGDSFEIEIEDDVDEVMVLAVVIAIDLVQAAQEAAAMASASDD